MTNKNPINFSLGALQELTVLWRNTISLGQLIPSLKAPQLSNIIWGTSYRNRAYVQVLAPIESFSKFTDKFTQSNGLAIEWCWLTDRHTETHTKIDGTDFRPSTADAGGNNTPFRKFNGRPLKESFHVNQSRTRAGTISDLLHDQANQGRSAHGLSANWNGWHGMTLKLVWVTIGFCMINLIYLCSNRP